jgi:hypothetical protein
VRGSRLANKLNKLDAVRNLVRLELCVREEFADTKAIGGALVIDIFRGALENGLGLGDGVEELDTLRGVAGEAIDSVNSERAFSGKIDESAKKVLGLGFASGTHLVKHDKVGGWERLLDERRLGCKGELVILGLVLGRDADIQNRQLCEKALELAQESFKQTLDSLDEILERQHEPVTKARAINAKGPGSMSDT